MITLQSVTHCNQFIKETIRIYIDSTINIIDNDLETKIVCISLRVGIQSKMNKFASMFTKKKSRKAYWGLLLKCLV